MKSRLFYSILLFVLGLVILVFPQLGVYLDTSSVFFDISKFLLDYPQFLIPFGILLIILGIVFFVIFMIAEKQENTVFIIQKPGDGNYGNADLHYPKSILGKRDVLIYESVVTIKNSSTQSIQYEAEKINRFFGQTEKKKRIFFLGISPIPSLVYAGHTVGDTGKKVTYFHWDRNKEEAIKIGNKGGTNFVREDEIVKKKSNDYVLCVSTSYEINKDIVKRQFPKATLLFYKSNEIGTESIKTKADILTISKSVREKIANISDSKASVHLLLSCSSELCFAIGRKLNSPALPKVLVYNFNRQSESPWDWNISLN